MKIHCGAVSIEKDKYMTPAHSLKTTRSSHSAQLLDSRPKGRGFEPHRRHCVVSLSKNINPSLVLVQPRKTRPFILERLLMGRKESSQTNKHSAQYRRHQTYSDALKNSFFPRTIPHWNSLPPSVANTQFTEEFRELLI